MNPSFRFLAILCLALQGLPASASAAGQPNVLMIPVDDLGDYISILQNHPGIKTPNFDRLAKRSVNFTRAYHFIRYADGAKELYDHQNDPHEYVNLAKQPELAPVIERLSVSLPTSWISNGRKKANAANN